MILFAHTRLGQELKIDAGQIGMAEKQIIGSYSSSIKLNSMTKKTLLDNGYPWGELVTHVFPLSEINRALDLARKPAGGSLKVAVSADYDSVDSLTVREDG
jgi:threonine dehydrogenase-like Zn-dependent dehydrogenase